MLCSLSDAVKIKHSTWLRSLQARLCLAVVIAISAPTSGDPPYPDRPTQVTLCLSDNFTFLQHLTPALVSQRIHKPSHLWHSISPRLEAKFAQLLSRKGTSHFGWAESLWWMSGGEKAFEVLVQRRGISCRLSLGKFEYYVCVFSWIPQRVITNLQLCGVTLTYAWSSSSRWARDS
jgi:hypothetical protein